MEDKTMNQIIALGKSILRNEKSTEFSVEDRREKLREKLQELSCVNGKPNYNRFQTNKHYLFEIISQFLPEVIPNAVENALGDMFDVVVTDHNDTYRYKLRKGTQNARNFVSQVAVGGNVKRTRLDSDYVDIDMSHVAGALYIPLNDYLSGETTLEECLTAIEEGIVKSIQRDAYVSLKDAFDSLPANNKDTANSYSLAGIKKVLNTISAYGRPVIYCTLEHAREFGSEASLIAEVSKQDLRENGYVGTLYGAPISLLPQSFEDANNTTKTFDPEYAFVLPINGTTNQKPGVIVLEGSYIVSDGSNPGDKSIGVEVSQKRGIALLNTNHLGIIRNTSL